MYLTPYRPRLAVRPINHATTLFDEFFGKWNGATHDGADTLLPSVDIYEKEQAIIVEAELPGIEKEDIKVDVKGRLLSLSGERNSTRETSEEGSYRSERRFGKFERTFRLPFEVKDNQVNATYRNGVLTLTIDKPEEQKAKQITID